MAEQDAIVPSHDPTIQSPLSMGFARDRPMRWGHRSFLGLEAVPPPAPPFVPMSKTRTFCLQTGTKPVHCPPHCPLARVGLDRESAMSQANLRLVDRDMMDRSKALDAALGQIERAFGKGSIMRLGQREKAVDAEVVSTGSLGLDIALGIGGLPRGRIVEIYGPESSGKTTLALQV